MNRLDQDYTVRAVRCDHRANDEEIYESLKRATDPLTDTWDRIANAKKILIKFNMMKARDRITRFAGRRQELVDDSVARAVLRLLRERTGAELIAIDTDCERTPSIIPDDFNYRNLLDAYGVRCIDLTLPPFTEYRVPGGGSMFDQYTLNACFKEADEVVSVAKMKSHLFMGITLTTKNLFGILPMIPPEGRNRAYFHHLIRLSYVLADLARITRSRLNIIDAMTSQRGREWGGSGLVTNTLVAGDNSIATDACGAWLMGHNPVGEWPEQPFLREKNHLLIAARSGFGTTDLKEIDFQSEVDRPIGLFETDATDSPETVTRWRKSSCRQALYYDQNRESMVSRYAGEYIFLQDEKVIWRGTDVTQLQSRRVMCGDRKNSGLWMKKVDPEEQEGERFGVYEECLAEIAGK